MRTLLLIIGLAAIAIGVVWVGQGLGYVRWPEDSFMISQTKWAWYGVALAVLGIGLSAWSRR